MFKITVDIFFVTFNNVQVQTCKKKTSFLLYNNKFYITTEYLCFYHKICLKCTSASSINTKLRNKMNTDTKTSSFKPRTLPEMSRHQ